MRKEVREKIHKMDVLITCFLSMSTLWNKRLFTSKNGYLQSIN